MRRRTLLLILAALLCGARFLSAAEVAIPPAPTAWVTDTAGALRPQTVQSLNAQLAAYERGTGHQVIVWIGPTTGDTPIEDWAVKAFEKWGVGQKGKDDGLAIFLMTTDRKVRIEVGYGLEGQVPDAVASRVIREVMTPLLGSGQTDAAVVQGVAAVLGAIGGDPGQAMTGASRGTKGPMPLAQKIFLIVLAVGFLFLLITNPSLAVFLLVSILTRGGGRGGGGGFSGGGGRSGGGGASGSW